MVQRFSSPLYSATTAAGEKVTIDVTNSISAGLEPNRGLLDHLVPWMKDRGYRSVLDFGAGALRHTIPLLNAGIEVIAVEYKKAYQRPKAAEACATAQKHGGFTALVWPHDFLDSSLTYDVALLMFVLQVIPVQADRKAVLKAIGDHFGRNGPKRLFYASRTGEARELSDDTKYKDGWVRGRGTNDRTFYTEWNAPTTDKLFRAAGYERAGTYTGASQPFVYDFKPGIL
jgi:hypothetical protein